MANETYSVVLSDAEVLALSGLLNADGIIGVDIRQSDSGDDHTASLVLATAMDALRARGLIARNAAGDIVVQRSLLELLVRCAFPHSAVLIYRWDKGEQTPVLLSGYRDKQGAGLHAQPEQALHEFLAIAEDELGDRIIQFCGLNGHHTVESPAYRIDNEVFSKIRVAAECEGSSSAISILKNMTDFDDELAEAFAVDMAATPQTVLIRSLTAQPDRQRHETTMSILVGEQGLWALTHTTKQVELQQITRETLSARLLKML